MRRRSSAYVDHICVADEFRRRGVARLPIEAVGRRAKEAGISRLEIDAWSANVDAKAAFKALGFNTYNEKMSIDV